MAVSFRRRCVANTDANDGRQTPSWTPSQGHVNSRVVQREDSQITKRNSLPNLDF
jgi:hypothetical protein